MERPTFDPQTIISQLTGDEVTALAEALSIRDPLLTMPEAAEYAKVDQRTLYNLATMKSGPTCCRIPIRGRNVWRFRLSALNAWIITSQVPSERIFDLSRDDLDVLLYAAGRITSLPKLRPVGIGEAAKLLKVTQRTLRRWDSNGRLKALRLSEGSDRRYQLMALPESNTAADPTGIAEAPPADRYLTTGEAAVFLRVHPKTLAAMRRRKAGPPYIAASTSYVTYRLADLEAYQEARRVVPVRGVQERPGARKADPAPTPLPPAGKGARGASWLRKTSSAI
jgi:excisionase family DNA binding protein